MDFSIDTPTSRRLTLLRLNISERWLPLLLPLAVFLIALLPRLLGLDVFLTADEDDQIMFANHFLKSALRGEWKVVGKHDLVIFISRSCLPTTF